MAQGMPFRPRLAVTLGDPCGVGPEVIVKALDRLTENSEAFPLVIGDRLAVQRAIDLVGASFRIQTVEDPSEAPAFSEEGTLYVKTPSSLGLEDIAYGRPTPGACHSIVQSIRIAVSWAREGKIDGMVTCPIHKANLHLNGFAFPGHTEFLQDLTLTPHVVMMLAGPRLRVALATIHHALSHVPRLLTPETLRKTIEITAHALRRDFGFSFPRLAVAALNPHAGEAGRFGNEENDIIEPVIRSFSDSFCRVSGPYSPDTLFHRAYEGEFDAVIAMYHDQGLIPVKLVHFYDAVNVTLGLPIVRTSVDHGTAYDIAGTGKAQPHSLLAAIQLAATIAQNRRNLPGRP
jgi:4-hydroxythreonine-4-phosphate dehydrogenase